jgi:hypothetical protein
MKQQHVQHRTDGKTPQVSYRRGPLHFSRVTAQYRQPCAAASIPAQRPSLAPSFAWGSHYYSRFHGEAHSELRSTLTARSDSLVKRLKKTSSTLAVLMLVVPIGKIDAQTVIPSDRNFAWNPGMMSKGGIPNRTTVCATLSPSGGDDSAAIQAALNSCPTSQVVMLNAGTFTVNNYLLIHSRSLCVARAQVKQS